MASTMVAVFPIKCVTAAVGIELCQYFCCCRSDKKWSFGNVCLLSTCKFQVWRTCFFLIFFTSMLCACLCLLVYLNTRSHLKCFIQSLLHPFLETSLTAPGAHEPDRWASHQGPGSSPSSQCRDNWCQPQCLVVYLDARHPNSSPHGCFLSFFFFVKTLLTKLSSSKALTK